MAELQGLAHFPGINQITDAIMSFTHGISPSVCTLTMAPQAHPVAEGGTLRFTFGDEVVEFPGCKIDDGSLRWDSQGQKWLLQILDRRWQWAWGEISGYYNVRNDDGSILDGTEKTPQELATLCLEAVDEQGFNVGALPNDARPSVEWDVAVPMEALANLCDGLGCRVVLGLNNRVTIAQAGVGAALPGGWIMEDELSVDPPEKPDELVIVLGPNRYQADFNLEAVAEDNDADNTIKLLDDLGYKPSGGWGLPPAHANIEDRDDQQLAQGSVFRMYRIVFPIIVPAYLGGQIADIRHLIVEDTQVASRLDNGVLVNKPAVVLGTWFDGNDAETNTPANTIYRRGDSTKGTMGFTIDAKRGLVLFSEPIFRNTGSGKIVADGASLKLRTAVSVRDADTFAAFRMSRKRELGNIGTPTRYVRHDELRVTYIDGVAQNVEEMVAAADDFLDGLEAEYEPTNPQTRKYAGLVAINLNGAIQHVTWTVGGQGATTTASRNTEQLNRIMPFKRRRELEKQRENIRSTYEEVVARIERLAPWSSA